MSYNHIMLGEPKLAPRVDPQKCVNEFGGNRYLMILYAAARAREIERKRNIKDKDAQKIHEYEYKPINEALKEIQEGKLKYGDAQ
jgi:DNA-directed RNA polymerase omega subunit